MREGSEEVEDAMTVDYSGKLRNLSIGDDVRREVTKIVFEYWRYTSPGGRASYSGIQF